MRSIIVDIARGRAAERRGGSSAHVTLDDDVGGADPAAEAQILRVHEALEEVGRIDQRLARLVEMRYFGGFDDEEIAEALELSDRTVRRDWQKAWLLLAEALRRWVAFGRIRATREGAGSRPAEGAAGRSARHVPRRPAARA